MLSEKESFIGLKRITLIPKSSSKVEHPNTIETSMAISRPKEMLTKSMLREDNVSWYWKMVTLVTNSARNGKMENGVDS
jgi:hypothetical protein